MANEVLQKDINGTLAAGAENFGGWQTIKGGRVTSATAQTRDPGSPYARALAGRKSIESITLGRDYDPVRDSAAEDRLETLCGTQTVFTVGKVVRDGAGNILRVKPRVGIVVEVMGPEGDTNSDTDKATLEVVVAING
jgi:hypothetical protein